MIQVLHVSAECYPAAKTGGLGDVVGSIPKYMTSAGALTGAIIPKYYLKWILGREWVTVYGGEVWNNWRGYRFTVQQEKGNSLGYPLFVVDIPGLYDRPGIYNDPSGAPYGDEVTRYIVFQQAVLDWLLSFPWSDRPRVLHCHDHHTGLIPWMLKYCPEYQELSPIPTVFTIHNGQYQGMFGWSSGNLLPPYRAEARGLVDWNGLVNPMAAAIKCAWAVTTVSQSYLYELHENSLGLEPLFRQEWGKQYGILNGIDAQVWNPETDAALQHRLDGEHWSHAKPPRNETESEWRRHAIHAFKLKNKRALCEWFGFPYDQPLISFIGRMVGEKGSDLLPDVYRRFIHEGGRASFLVLGTGEAWTQNQFRAMAHQYPGRFNAVIDYNEALAHQIYAGSDYLIMPSRVEPCGLNQMYSMRYGTIPIVRAVGGLKDTVPDIGQPDGTGRGIRFEQFSLEDVYHAVYRAVSMWHNDPGTVAALRERIMDIDFSWETAIDRYVNVYRRLGANIEFIKAEPPRAAPRPGAQAGSDVAESKPPKKVKTQNHPADTKSGVVIETPPAGEYTETALAPPEEVNKDKKSTGKPASSKKIVSQKPADTETAEMPETTAMAPDNGGKGKTSNKPPKKTGKPGVKQQTADTRGGSAVSKPADKKTTEAPAPKASKTPKKK